MLNPNPPPINPAFVKHTEDQPPPYTPPAYNPGFVQPSAPPLSHVTGPTYNHDGFFGATTPNQDQLGREMLGAVVAGKTDWVSKSTLPLDSTFNVFLSYIGNLFPATIDPNKLDNKTKSKLWREVGELRYAEMLGDNAMIQSAERTTDALFQQFASELTHEADNPDYCFSASLECQMNPEALFDRGKLHFKRDEYPKAIEDFQKAGIYAKSLANSSSYRINRFKALMKTCAAAANERLGLHDKALFQYIDAATIDPDGPKYYEDSLSRNFQILKLKPNKCDEELQACMEYDPYEPDFAIEFASCKLNQNQVEAAIELLNKSNKLAFSYKPQALYRCAELAQQIAFCVNN